MPADARALINIRSFLDAQRRERYRAFVVHGAPQAGKTAFARKLAEITGGRYIDVLATVAGAPQLAAQVDALDANYLREVALTDAVQGVNVIVLDEFDFLLPVWSGDVASLIEIVRKLSVTETEAVIGFVMQTVSALETLTVQNSAGQSRILRLDEIEGLK